jgi:DNA-binding transcriptional ArsR family regulator
VSGKRRRARKKDHRPRGLTQQEAVLRALTHPVRAKVLTILADCIACPSEIAERIGVPLPNVGYHVRVLSELGLIEIWEEESRRGSVAHFYRLTDREFIGKSEWKDLDPKVRNAVSGFAIENLVADAAASLAAGLFDQRPDRVLLRTPLVLDEKGWQEVLKAYERLTATFEKVQSKASERLAGAENGHITALAAALFFEIPRPSSTN